MSIDNSVEHFIVVSHDDRVEDATSLEILPQHAALVPGDVRVFGPDDLHRCRLFVSAAAEQAHGNPDQITE